MIHLLSFSGILSTYDGFNSKWYSQFSLVIISTQILAFLFDQMFNCCYNSVQIMGRLSASLFTLLGFSGGIPFLYLIGLLTFGLSLLTSRDLDFSPHTVISMVEIMNISIYYKLIMGVFILEPSLFVMQNLLIEAIEIPGSYL